MSDMLNTTSSVAVAQRSPLAGERSSATEGLRGRAMKFFVAAGIALSLLIVPATPASAWTSTSIGTAAATSWGFKCNSSYNWVHQNWPNISVRTSALQYVYVRAFLYRWNGAKWVNARTSQWYVGVSNVNGRHVLGYTAGHAPVGQQPYLFAIAGHPSLVPPNDGYSFTNLSDGYYTTVEQYYAAGRYWSAQNSYQNSYQGGTPTSCKI